MENNTIISIIIGSLIGFILLRELVTWYLKLNDIKKNQDRIIYLLTKILVQQGGYLTEEDKKEMKY